MALGTQLKGARLEFVKRPCGPFETTRYSWDKKKKQLVKEKVQHERGWLLFTPFGQSYRLTEKQLVDRGYARTPKVMNLRHVEDTTTAAGRYKYAIDPAERKAALREMEDAVIKRSTDRRIPIEGDQETVNA